MVKRTEDLDALWARTGAGTATLDEKVRAIVTAGKLGLREYVPRVLDLLADPDGEVRSYALQTLVLDLNQRSEAMSRLCWKLASSDESWEARQMAISCLGSMLFNSRSRSAFNRLKSLRIGWGVAGSVASTGTRNRVVVVNICESAGPPQANPAFRRKPERRARAALRVGIVQFLVDGHSPPAVAGTPALDRTVVVTAGRGFRLSPE